MNGLGRIFQRGPVYWIAYYHRGIEHRESAHASGTKGETAAKKLLKKRLGEIGRGHLIGPQEEKVTFEEMAKDLEADYSINGKRSGRTLHCLLRHLRGGFALMRAAWISPRTGCGPTSAHDKKTGLATPASTANLLP